MTKNNTKSEIKEQLQILVKQRFGRPLNSVKSFEELSENIHLGVQTLRRFFGKIDQDKEISISSLNMLCRYVGFSDWQDFSSDFENQKSLSEKDRYYIENMSVFFENGDRYNLDYYQNTMILDTLNDFGKVIYKKIENFQFFQKLYYGNDWCSDYYLAWLPNYNYFAQNWFKEILTVRINHTKNILVKLALNNFLFFGCFLSNKDCESFLETNEIKNLYDKYHKNFEYMPYHEMRYHTVLLILAKKNNDKEEFQRILTNYLNCLDKSGLEEIYKQELIIFFCNTLLWLQEYELAYYYLKKAKPFLKLYPVKKQKKNSIHFFGINLVFIKTTFLLAWSANQDSDTDNFELTDSDFNDITGLLYNDYIKLMYLAKCIITENGLAKKKFLFQELKVLVEKTNYYRIYIILEDLDSNFLKYSA